MLLKFLVIEAELYLIFVTNKVSQDFISSFCDKNTKLLEVLNVKGAWFIYSSVEIAYDNHNGHS